jgi:hypothetical protein
MAPAVADYAAAWAWAADPHPEDTYQQLLDPLLGLYERRVQGLLDARAVLDRVDPAAAGTWAAAEVQAAREVVATVLDAAAATGQPGRARGLASGYLAGASALDGQPAGSREVERFIGPVLAVAQSAGDDELAASALSRLSPRKPDDMPHPEPDPDPDPDPDLESSPTVGTGDSLTPVMVASDDATTGQNQAVLFGARV